MEWNQWMIWLVILGTAQYHAMNLNLIFHEIIGKNCGIHNMAIVLIPHLVIQLYNPSMYIVRGLALIIWGICVFLWIRYSNRLCNAFRMNWFWSMPSKNNNPHSVRKKD